MKLECKYCKIHRDFEDWNAVQKANSTQCWVTIKGTNHHFNQCWVTIKGTNHHFNRVVF